MRGKRWNPAACERQKIHARAGSVPQRRLIEMEKSHLSRKTAREIIRLEARTAAA